MNTQDMFKAIPMSSYDTISQPKAGYSNISDVSLESLQDRMIPRQMVTGSTRGTQTVGYGGTKIDGTNNRIIITNSADGTSIGMGVIPGSLTEEFGFFSLDADDNLIMKIVGGTQYVYDPDTDLNRYQSGKLPDDTYGAAGSNDGSNVADGFDA